MVCIAPWNGAGRAGRAPGWPGNRAPVRPRGREWDQPRMGLPGSSGGKEVAAHICQFVAKPTPGPNVREAYLSPGRRAPRLESELRRCMGHTLVMRGQGLKCQHRHAHVTPSPLPPKSLTLRAAASLLAPLRPIWCGFAWGSPLSTSHWLENGSEGMPHPGDFLSRDIGTVPASQPFAAFERFRGGALDRSRHAFESRPGIARATRVR